VNVKIVIRHQVSKSSKVAATEVNG